MRLLSDTIMEDFSYFFVCSLIASLADFCWFGGWIKVKSLVLVDALQ